MSATHAAELQACPFAHAACGAAMTRGVVPPCDDVCTCTCLCRTFVPLQECCEPYHTGAAVPPDVEAALRARFCAFVKGRWAAVPAGACWSAAAVWVQAEQPLHRWASNSITGANDAFMVTTARLLLDWPIC